jgi:general secretion pathway protein L
LSAAFLIFLDPRQQIEGWLSLADGRIAGRGSGLEALPPLIDPDTQRPVEVVAVVPGETVALHWLEVPAGLAPAQAAAAARLMASEASAQPLSEMHVAVGPEDGSELRPVALVPALIMAGWLGRLQAEGLDPDVVIPEPLLLAPPAEGFVRFDRGDVPLYRGRHDAFSVEPELAGLVIADAPVRSLDADAFEIALPNAIASPAVNLRQGDFAKRRKWKIEWKQVRRLALLLLAILAVTLAIQIASIWRYTYAADALEREANRIAGEALGRDSADPVQLERRLSELRGGGVGYAAIASAVFAAVRATPSAELSSIVYDRDGTMRLTVMADSAATIGSLEQRIEAAGFAADQGPMRVGGGRPTTDITVRAR